MRKRACFPKILAESVLSIVSAFAVIMIAGSLYISIGERLTGKMMFLFGYKPVFIESGSMEPAISTGQIILIKKCAYESIEEGDIITFKSGHGYVTHRFIGIDNESLSSGDSKYLITKGDANNIADPARLDPDDIEGVVVDLWE